ncbi:bifunctional riboflavin kinase/FAD synthetase [Chromatocurvus halotolerans]|uniref:Riboflavin biosynthesis protein n=1 Tax=Chromatocurvus halotolerans TaxID=1132028 RepID=A0A4R2KUQ3_9GAMM|nr:bifunctional riboflavin kinase/FAD synthetase [Chromatocurvus halotolerans]TCO74869.1 riboflavin kinase/FMN adenylyltransferase [Chromatocurvus halotolerans]
MELIRGLHNLRSRHRGCVATIGAFDGVHLGHQAVLGQLLDEAVASSLPSVVIVFEPLPREYLVPEEAPARLMSFREKCLRLSQLGVDRLLCIRFDETLRGMSAMDFAQALFVRGLGVQRLVLGDDFRFGREREGDATFLRELGQREGFSTLPTKTFALGGERVSSTRVRDALAAGDLALAARLLGRDYAISGRVVRGHQLGRQLGAPTANVELRRLRSPLAGVFAVRVDGGALAADPGVANVGTRPTVSSGTRANLEVHLLEGSPDLYGRRIDVHFVHRLRAEKKYDSLEALRDAIQTDIDTARRWFQQNSLAPHHSMDSSDT